MYRINVLSSGKYHNVVTGPMYCLSKKDARWLVKTYTESECNFTVEKLIRVTGTIFCWSDYEVEDSIFPNDNGDEIVD